MIKKGGEGMDTDPKEQSKEFDASRALMLKQEFQFRGWSEELKEKVAAFASFYCYDVKSNRHLAELIDFARKEEK